MRVQAGFASAMTNILEVFDPATTNWTTRAPMPTTRGDTATGGSSGGTLHQIFSVQGINP